MNLAFDEVLRADVATRQGLFATTAIRLGTTPQNVEKDFWVCWTLDALFNGLTDRPRLLFKGGTSLSKGFGLINRFSEDIDVTVFRDDLGLPASVQELTALSRNKRDQALDAIRTACETYINAKKPCLVLDHLAQERTIRCLVFRKMRCQRINEVTAAGSNLIAKARFPSDCETLPKIVFGMVPPRQIPVQQEKGGQPLLTIEWLECAAA